MKGLLLSLVAVAALTGCAGAGATQQPPSTTRASSAPASSSATAEAEPAAEPGPRTPSSRSVVPTELRLGDIDARVVPVALEGSRLTPPDDPTVLGWWGKRAGSARGTTLLTGHTVHDGGGTFDDLEDTPLGAVATVDGHPYEVTSVRVLSKEQLARRAPALFSQNGRPRLVLVTCEDYDPATGHYASNVVVVLTPVA